MSEWIRIRVKDFYKDAVGELEYTYVTREVYEALADTFRKEAHAQEMRDIRHTTKDGYTEGETEDLVELTGESVEDTVIRQMEIETLQKAMQSLTPVQRERLHFYFFEGMTYRQIAAKEGVGEKNIRESINGAVKNSCSNRADVLSASHAVKKTASKEPSGKAGVQPVCGGQARRGEWPIMIHLEISQHAVVEVRFL